MNDDLSLAAVEAADARRLSAMSATDIHALNLLLDDALSYVHSTGEIMDKHAYLSHVSSHAFRYGPITATTEAGHMFDGTAVLIRAVGTSIVKDGQPRNLALKVQTVWRTTGGEWRLLTSISIQLERKSHDGD